MNNSDHELSLIGEKLTEKYLFNSLFNKIRYKNEGLKMRLISLFYTSESF